MSALDKYQRILASKGVALGGLGLGEIALRRSDTIEAIHALRKASVAILGGDVYSERAGKVESAYANWHVDRDTGEEEAEFAARSCITAESYVEHYPGRTGEEPLFVLVVAGFKMDP